MTGNPEIIRLNIRYYEDLLTRDSTTYSPDQVRILLEDAKARLPGIKAKASSPRA